MTGKKWSAFIVLHKGRSQLCGSAGLSYRLVLYQRALVKTELATECPSAVKKRPQATATGKFSVLGHYLYLVNQPKDF